MHISLIFRYDGQNTDSKSMNVTENYHAIHWTQMRSESLLDFYNEAPLEMQCQSGSGNYRPNNFNEKERTENALV